MRSRSKPPLTIQRLRAFQPPQLQATKADLYWICEKCAGVIMQGRVHYYEGYLMSGCSSSHKIDGHDGGEELFLTNAAGGVNPNFKPGDL